MSTNKVTLSWKAVKEAFLYITIVYKVQSILVTEEGCFSIVLVHLADLSHCDLSNFKRGVFREFRLTHDLDSEPWILEGCIYEVKMKA